MSIVNTPGKLIRGLRQEENCNYRIDEVPVSTNTTETSGLINGELTYTGIALAGVRNDARIVVLESPIKPGYSLEAITPEIATVDDTGYVEVTTQTFGTAEFHLHSPAGSRRIERYCAQGAASSYAIATDYASGSLAKHVLSQVSALVSGKTSGNATQSLWSIESGNIDSPSGTLNSNNFAAAYNWNACSMLTSGRIDDRFPLILISSRHAITANHVAPAIGSRAVFKRPNGTYQTVTVSKSDRVGTQDLRLIYFDSAVTGIDPYKLPPSDWIETFVPSALVSPAPYIPTCQIPLLIKGMHDHAGALASYVGVFGASALKYVEGTTAIVSRQQIQHAALSTWTPMAFIGGDSGSPIFLSVNDELVLIGVVVIDAGGFSRMYGSDVFSVLPSLMTTQAGVASEPVYADFSGFNDYS